jgi:REP element-mobilizing transposase RayT
VAEIFLPLPNCKTPFYLASMNPKRRSIRLPGYDYASAGWYFVTIICHKRQPLFGEIVRAYGIRPDDSEVILSPLGTIVHEEWLKTAELRPEVELGEFVVMPNHFHAIIGLNGNFSTDDTGANPAMSTTGVCDTPLRSPSKTIGAVIRGFKSAVSGQARRSDLATDVWHRNYHEHIIRNDDSYRRITLQKIRKTGKRMNIFQ